MQQIESERIVNLADLEQLIRDARVDMLYLKNAIKDGKQEASKHLVEQVDLKLHRMEAFEFVIERRTIFERSLREGQ